MGEHGTGPKAPTYLSIKLPPDVAELLHRLAYETGRSKRDLVIAAVRQAYGDDSLCGTALARKRARCAKCHREHAEYLATGTWEA
jgi:predicted transcriptional regulator